MKLVSRILSIRDQAQHALLRHSAIRTRFINSNRIPAQTYRAYIFQRPATVQLYSTSRITFNLPAKRPTMSSDEAYSSFLDQANQDTGASKAPAQKTSEPKFTAKAVDTDIPATLQKVEQYYTSEADEPFEPVSLKWGGKNMPSESAFLHSI